MKTKNIIMILAALPLVAGLTGCKSDDELNAKPANETLIVEGGDITLLSSEDKKYVEVTADCSWQVVEFQEVNEAGDIDVTKSYSGDFGSNLIVEPMRGSGDATLVIQTGTNGGTLKRGNAFIVLRSDRGLQQRINITQLSSDPGMGIAGTTDGCLDYGTAGGTKTLTIESNTSWTLEQTPGTEGWLKMSKTGSNGSDVVNVTVDAQSTDEARSATLSFVYGAKRASVIVRQGAKTDITLSVEPNNLLFPEAYYMPDSLFEHEREHWGNWWESAEGKTVKVACNASWHVYVPSSATSWVYVEPSAGVGNGEFTVKCCPWSTSPTSRLTLVMVVAGSQNPQQSDILIQQPVDGQQPFVPTPSTTPDVGQLTSMYVGNTSASFRFAFACSQPVLEYGVVYSMSNRQPTLYDASYVVSGGNKSAATVLAEVNNLEPSMTYYVRAFVRSQSQEVVYSPNMVTITTSSSAQEPGESDNPDPQLAPRR